MDSIPLYSPYQESLRTESSHNPFNYQESLSVASNLFPSELESPFGLTLGSFCLLDPTTWT